MSPRLYLRHLIRDRLTAAAEEIFSAFEKSIDVYEEELDRLRKLLEVVGRPEVGSRRIGLPQQSACEEEILIDQESSSSVELIHIKEDLEEISVTPEEKPCVFEQETDTLVSPLDNEGSGTDDDQELLSHGCPEDLAQQPAFEEDILPNQESSSGLESTHIKEDLEEISITPEEEPCLLSHSCPEEFSQLGVWKQRSNSNQEEPVKPEMEQISISQYPEQFVLKQIPDDEERDHMETNSDHEKFENQSHVLTAHIRKHTGEKPYTYQLSGRGYNALSSFVYHKDMHTEEKPHALNNYFTQNSLHFTQQHELEAHMMAHTGVNAFICNICNKSFRVKSQLIVHMRTHTGEKPFTCESCGKGFQRKQALTFHMRTHTGEKPFSCESCGKGFVKQSDLKVHMRTHTGEKPFSCEVCGKHFTQHHNLKSHMMTHKGENPYICSICNESFAAKSKLMVHMRTHTGEKSFTCESCGKRFLRKQALTFHMRTHTGEKPFSCEMCGKGFVKQSVLKVHMRTHTGEKPFSCETCGKRFTQQHNLKYHMRAHTGEKQFSFETCG